MPNNARDISTSDGQVRRFVNWPTAILILGAAIWLCYFALTMLIHFAPNRLSLPIQEAINSQALVPIGCGCTALAWWLQADVYSRSSAQHLSVNGQQLLARGIAKWLTATLLLAIPLVILIVILTATAPIALRDLIPWLIAISGSVNGLWMVIAWGRSQLLLRRLL